MPMAMLGRCVTSWQLTHSWGYARPPHRAATDGTPHRLGRAGFAPIRAEWLAHAAGIGAPIRARTARTTHEGRFETIDATGALILATERGPLALSAAEVFPLAE